MTDRIMPTLGIALGLAMLFMVGCTYFGVPAGQDRVEADTLEREIANYKQWDRPELWEEDFYKSAHPLPEYVRYYANKTANETLDNPADGAIFVKEQYDKDKQFIGLTVMKKIDGYDPPNNDWYWAIADTNARIRNAGRLDSPWTSSCITCHKKGDGGGDLLFVND